jgi:hypothetical protein
LGKKNFFDSKNDVFYTKNGDFLHLLLVCTIFFVYIVYTLFVRVPVRFSDCSLTVPSHHVLVPLHHGLPQNEVAFLRTRLPTLGMTDREKAYSELSASLGQEAIRSTVFQTNTDKDEMEEVVDEEDPVEGEGVEEGEGEAREREREM